MENLTDRYTPERVSRKLSKLKKAATNNKKSDIKKSIKLLFEAKKLNDKYYIDLILYVRLAKYLTEDKQFEKALQLMQTLTDKLSKYNYIEIYKKKHYTNMNTIFETIAYIYFHQNKIENALFYKLQSIGYDLILQSMSYTVSSTFTLEEWIGWNSNRLYKSIFKSIDKQVKIQTLKILEETYEEFKEKIFVCRKFYSDNPFIWSDELKSEPKEIKQLISEIIKIPQIISGKSQKLTFK